MDLPVLLYPKEYIYLMASYNFMNISWFNVLLVRCPYEIFDPYFRISKLYSAKKIHFIVSSWKKLLTISQIDPKSAISFSEELFSEFHVHLFLELFTTHLTNFELRKYLLNSENHHHTADSFFSSTVFEMYSIEA